MPEDKFPKVNDDLLLKILSNSHRRSILKLLSAGDRYAYELSKILNITPRAVTNHLEHLKERGLIISESRKSKVGPNRSYFSLKTGLVFRISIGQNLYYSNVSNLQLGEEVHVSPKLQLEASQKNKTLLNTLEEGLDFLPEIKKELEILDLQQTRLLRKYQGMLLHLGNLLNFHGLNKSEIKLILELIEKNGSSTQQELLTSLELTPVTLSPVVTSLMDKNILKHNILVESGKPPINEYVLAVKL